MLKRWRSAPLPPRAASSTAIAGVVLIAGVILKVETAQPILLATFRTAFWWSIGFSVLALVPAFALPSAGAKKTAAAGHDAPARPAQGAAAGRASSTGTRGYPGRAADVPA